MLVNDAASKRSIIAVISKSRFTASSSTPVPEPTVADLLNDTGVEAAEAGAAFIATAE